MKYPIESEQFYGMSHSDGIFRNVQGEVELSDKEVATLARLMQEQNTSDVEQLNLEESEPDIYEKLYDACDAMCDEAAFNEAWLEAYWNAWSGADGGNTVEYNIDQMMYYCEGHCGFSFEGEETDVDYEEKKAKAFEKWLDHYLHTAPDADVLTFFEQNMELLIDDCDFVDPSAVEYNVTVLIPQTIIDIAFPKK